MHLKTLLLLAASVAVTSVSSGAAPARVGGFYDLTEVSLEKSEPTLRLTLRLVNLGETTIENATVSLTDTLHPYRSYGSFPPLTLTPQEGLDISAVFQVPRIEGEYWQEGGMPRLFIYFRDTQGRPVKQPLELLRRALEAKP